MYWRDDIDPHSPVALLDKWLEERGFVNRKQHNVDITYGGEGRPVVQILRPHANEWLFSLAPKNKSGKDPLLVRLWGPGLIYHGLSSVFNLAAPDSFDQVTSTISAWRKVKYLALKEMWRLVKILEHRGHLYPRMTYAHWVVAMSDQPDYPSQFKADFERVCLALNKIGVDLRV